jgi:hypothetical protein
MPMSENRLQEKSDDQSRVVSLYKLVLWSIRHFQANPNTTNLNMRPVFNPTTVGLQTTWDKMRS